MITYDKSLWGNRALFRVYGSAFPRSLPYAALASCIAVTLAALFQTTGWELFHNPYPIQLFFFVVGFIVVFRCECPVHACTCTMVIGATCAPAYICSCGPGANPHLEPTNQACKEAVLQIYGALFCIHYDMEKNE